MTRTLAGAESALEAIERASEAGLGAQELLEDVAARIDRVVPSDGYFLAATDPETTLCMGAGIVHELPHELCGPTWEYEFLVPDYLKFADLVQSGNDVGDLHEATGFRSELRVVFALDGAADVAPLIVEAYELTSLFETVGVSSRGELVAKMFAEHYSPPSRYTGQP